jgi:uncharacterized membrane protein YeaQ/YmgE (transglycosylase-associated protein family)
MLDLLYYIVIGLIAGWLAGRILKDRSMGLVGNLLIGVTGAVLGAYIFEFFGISSGGFIGTLISAVIGAVILLYVIQALRKAG